MEKENNSPKQHSSESEKQKESILSYLALKNGQALQELQAQIYSYQKEIEGLKAEINALENAADQPDQFLAFASSQSKKTAQDITDTIDHEFAGIEEEGRMINERHKQKIMDLDAKMQQGIQYAYKLMNDMLEKTNQQKQSVPVKSPAANSPENSNFTAREKVYQEKIPPQETKNVTMKETAYQEARPAIQPNNIDMRQPVYQEVQPAVQPGNIDMRQPVYQEVQPAMQPGNIDRKQPAYQEVIDRKQPVYQENRAAAESGNVKIIEGFWEEPQQQETQPKAKPETTRQDDVTGLKNMYVIGKIAGDDLFDRSGKLIIAKNEIITQDVIEKAEREGNLIELVLEMKLQEG